MKRSDYDIIIIGAGIGGLICGCYLSAAGKKVLIIDKNEKVGGYCTSFQKDGFLFDSAVHSLGACREGGDFDKILAELDVRDKIEILRAEPSDIISASDFEIVIQSNPEETKESFRRIFKKESSRIDSFFDLIMGSDFNHLYLRLRDRTFRDLLDEYFVEERLKASFGIFLGNMGIPPSKVSALSAAVLYRNFILDGGYYPRGGMQSLSDILADCFIKNGGKIILNHLVEKIIIKNNNVKGVKVDSRDIYTCKNLVSSADMRQTFCTLTGEEFLGSRLLADFKRLKTSSSAFVVYLGVDRMVRRKMRKALGIWRMPDNYDIEGIFSKPHKNQMSHDQFVFCSAPSFFDSSLAPENGDVLKLIVNAPFKSEKFWSENKLHYASDVIGRVQNFIPDIAKYIRSQAVATPESLHRYTLNFLGAMGGWFSSPEQLCQVDQVIRKIKIRNLFFAGHWAAGLSGFGGVIMAASSGRRTAKKLLRSKK